ncbi:MAG: arylsulfatase [Planctomycetota bacterium]
MQSRRRFLRAAAGSALGLACGGLLARAARAADPKRPNILLLMADDMGFSDIGCYGGETRTPHLDRLAKSGIRFTHFYNNAKCAPTRASLLTGLYDHAVGTRSLAKGVTLAEVLKAVGYRTLMTGKWHQTGLPTDRGFDRYFGLADGCCNYWNPGPRREGEPKPGRKRFPRRWGIDDKAFRPWTPPEDFYTTDAFTDYALRYLDQYGREGKPWLLYVAYTAPHYPLHAWPEDIARYRGKYMKGWDALRQARYQRMIRMGLIDPRWKLSPRHPRSKDWDKLPEDEQKAWDLKMAVYAAMIDRMDQNIGRLLAKLRELGQEENTLVLFLSDNGGCAENVNNTPDIPPGPVESYRTVDLPWANASNTPFRKFKSDDHEGGVATPLIACWPAVIKKGGGLTHQMGHIIDVMATCLDVSGATYPAERDGKPVLPLEGKSLLPIFQGKQRDGHEALYWQFGNSRAVRQGKWKLVADGNGPWELYDMEADRTELHDLANEHPARAQELAALWDAWARRVGARRPKRRKK